MKEKKYKAYSCLVEEYKKLNEEQVRLVSLREHLQEENILVYIRDVFYDHDITFARERLLEICNIAIAELEKKKEEL